MRFLFIQDLFEARKLFLYVKTTVTDSFAVAFDVLGSGATDDLMSNQERKRLEDSRRKRRSETITWAGGARRGNLLNMMVAGGKKLKRDKTNAPCFE